MELNLLKKKLAQGSFAGLVRTGLAIPLYLILTPFVLHKLGPELFGLWSLGTLVISAMAITDFGLKNAFVHYVASDPGNHNLVNQHFNVTFLTYLVMALAVLFVTLIFGEVISIHLLQVPQTLRAEASFVLWVNAVGFGLRFLSIPFQAIIEAHQEHATVQKVLLGWLLANFFGTLIALSLQPSIYTLGIVTIASNAFVLIALWLYIIRNYSFIWISPGIVQSATVKAMLRYGSGVQFASLLIVVREPAIKVLIARTSDLSSVATFEIVFKLCTQLVSLVTSPLQGSFAASALLSKDRIAELEQILRLMYGFCIAVFVPATLFMISFSQILVELWLGPDYRRVGSILPLTFAAFAIYYTTEILYKAIEASGLSGYSALAQFVSLSVTIGIFFIFVETMDQAVPVSLFGGFVTYSLLNLLVFRLRFPTVRLCGFLQWVWLIGPALIYIVMQILIPVKLALLLFILYIIVHLWCMRRAGLFDLFRILCKLSAVIGVKP